MDEHEVIGSAFAPGGVELRLVRSDDDFAILLRDNELMSTDIHASEEALATLTCQHLAGCPAPQLLIGGYGMGFTLRAALAALEDDASVVVAELVPEIIEWALGPLRELTGACLDDPRVVLVMEDVAVLIAAAQEAYDAILLDVDNGPDGLIQRVNDQLYAPAGLQAAMAALRPGGILAIWSAEADAAFTTRLEQAGFAVSETLVNSLNDDEEDGEQHMIWFARKALTEVTTPVN